MDYVVKVMTDCADEKVLFRHLVLVKKRDLICSQVVIVSQWTSYLDLIGQELSKEGVPFVE